jgi:hypothetical protein
LLIPSHILLDPGEHLVKHFKAIVPFLLCLCLVANSLAADTWVLREDGIGPVKIGMSLSQLNAVLQEKFSKPTEEWESQECFYVKPSRHPHITFMIEDGRVSRVDVDGAVVATSTGIRVGHAEARALKIYGSALKIDSHQYIETGHYLTIQSNSGRYGIRFETDQGRITTFYGGLYSAIQYVEGCQ